MVGFVVRTPVMSMPSYMGRSLTLGPASLSWQLRHTRRSLRGCAVSFAIAARRVVDSEGEHGDSGSLDAKNLFRRRPGCRRIEFAATRAASVLTTSSTGVEVAVDKTLVPCRPWLSARTAKLAFCEKGFFSPPVGQKIKSGCCTFAEQFDMRVDLGGVMQAAAGAARYA